MDHKRAIPLALLLLFVGAAGAARADKIDDFVNAEMTKQHIPGMAIAIVKDGQIVKAAGYGCANLELNVPVTAETVFKIASISKQFLATGILLLAQDGKLTIDDKVSQHLAGTPETWSDITIRHLLTHTSGLLREAPGFQPFKIVPDAEVIRSIYPIPLRTSPGERYEYSNAGFSVLAEIIGRVSGKSWAAFLDERVFKPLGMTATCPTNYSEVVPNRANGYDSQPDGKYKNSQHYIAIPPAGAFLSNVLDMAKWDAALYSDQILTHSTRDAMCTPVHLNDGTTHPYGFGWQLAPAAGHKLMSHGGSLPGFRSEFSRYLDDRLCIVVLSNLSNANPVNIARGIAALEFKD